MTFVACSYSQWPSSHQIWCLFSSWKTNTWCIGKEVWRCNRWQPRVGNYEDTFWNRALKVHHSSAWDDCNQFKVHKLVLDAISPGQREALSHTEILKNRKIAWDGLWVASKAEAPMVRYPRYLLNYYTIVGYGNAHNLTIGIYFTHYIPFADTYIGLIAAIMNLELQE